MKKLLALLIAFLPFIALLAFPWFAGLMGLSQGGPLGPGDVYEQHLGIGQRIVPICYMQGKEPPAADFELVDQYNRTVRLSDLWQSPVIVTFGYTYCPDVCPLINLVLNATLPKLDGVKAVEVTLDPKRDTPRRLEAYSKGNRFNWTFVTGPEDRLQQIWRAYGVTRVVQGDYIAHDVIFVVVKDGKILGAVKGLPTPDELARYIKRIIERNC